MGYIFNTEMFLQEAKRVCKKGGIIHMHILERKERVEERAKSIEEKYNLKLVEIRKVKSYAPRVYHYVLLLENI